MCSPLPEPSFVTRPDFTLKGKEGNKTQQTKKIQSLQWFQADDDNDNIDDSFFQASAGVAVVSVLYPVFFFRFFSC